MDEEFDFFAGVDWATEEHAVCVEGSDGQLLEERVYQHSADGLDALCNQLRHISGDRLERVAIGIEVPHGPVVETLLERGFAVYSINPKQLDRFRDRFTMAGAKDDRLDARVLADSLRTDRHRFRRVVVGDPATLQLREWSRMSDELRQERVRLCNRLREQLRRYYPQMVSAVSNDLGANWALDLWERASTPAKARRLRETTVVALLKRHRIRKITADEILRILRQPELKVAQGTPQAAAAHIALLIPRIRLVNEQIRECEKQLDAALAVFESASESADDDPENQCEQRDAAILRSMPGIGRVNLATLLAEASQPLAERDYQTLRGLSGVAPVTRRSGKHCIVIMRKACHPRLRNALYHWARVAVQVDPTSRARYAALRGRGHRHGRALRTVGDRLLYVACAMLRSGTMFEPHHATAVREAA